MSDYEIVNGITHPAASEQDKLVASVELAGWRITLLQEPRINGTRYMVVNPRGNIVGYRNTRYGGALLADRYLMEPRLELLYPTPPEH